MRVGQKFEDPITGDVAEVVSVEGETVTLRTAFSEFSINAGDLKFWWVAK